MHGSKSPGTLGARSSKRHACGGAVASDSRGRGAQSGCMDLLCACPCVIMLLGKVRGAGLMLVHVRWEGGSVGWGGRLPSRVTGEAGLSGSIIARSPQGRCYQTRGGYIKQTDQTDALCCGKSRKKVSEAKDPCGTVWGWGVGGLRARTGFVGYTAESLKGPSQRRKLGVSTLANTLITN